MLQTIPSNSQQFRALLITKTRGWHHASINEGVAAMKELSVKHQFDLQWHQESSKITDQYLERFNVLIFLNTTGDIFTADEKNAIENFIRSGKGYVGVHAASDTEYDWEWYTRLVGRMFVIHPAIQTAKLRFTGKAFPGLHGFVDGQLWTEEWYTFSEEKVKGLEYILAVDESTYSPAAESKAKNVKSAGMGAFHPVAWYHEFDGGRSFYTALGHMPTDYTDASFLSHLYGGIYWAATGKK